ncbi:MAG: hypothetical protein HWN66_21930 [Candidatus Helarchaeota archaeon]|nr:hypothetical protein [Candidatus Helarchaeota archaeon]
MKRKILVLINCILVLLVIGCRITKVTKHIPDKAASAAKVIYAGVRSSSYGIKPFPEPQEWQNAIETMSGYFEDSTPCAIWIVGKFKGPNECHLFFPSDGNNYTNIQFNDTDKHEKYLSYFDKAGIKVFLQVEPANADVNTLIDLVLNRYKNHECVIGFGVDVEWYRESENPEWGVKVEDDIAKAWEARVKSHNNNYRLFLKHWDRDWMPKKYRGDIIFVDDSQVLENLKALIDEFVDYWADFFEPNTVCFQIGYKADKSWWQELNNPPKDIGDAIKERIEQNFGVFWVDFTLRDVLPTSPKKNNRLK